MDNKELISQIAEMMEVQNKRLDKRLEEQTQSLKKYVDDKLEQQTQGLIEYIDRRLEDHTQRIEIKIENEVTKKIEALFDGYKLTHEKQWELERKVDALARAVEELQARIA